MTEVRQRVLAARSPIEPYGFQFVTEQKPAGED
jgi:hypothetical protein